MPLIALDDVGRLLHQHPKHAFLSGDPKETLPKAAHSLVQSLGLKQLWQVLTFSPRELLAHDPSSQTLLEPIANALAPYSLALRENAPFALRTGNRYVKSISEGTNILMPFYEDTTFYWTRWTAMTAATKLAIAFPGITPVFRSETLRLGYVLRP